MNDGPLQRYRSMVFKGELAPDTAQELAAEKLQLLGNRLAHYAEPRLGDVLNPFARKRRVSPEGLYLYGGVGRGKTMLLDLFFEAVPFAPKRRVHFQEFMAEVHDAIEHARKAAADPIASAADTIASSAAPALLRRAGGDRHCRRHDPRPAVPALVPAQRRDRGHVEHFSPRPLPGRAQPSAVSALHRADRAAHGGA